MKWVLRMRRRKFTHKFWCYDLQVKRSENQHLSSPRNYCIEAEREYVCSLSSTLQLRCPVFVADLICFGITIQSTAVIGNSCSWYRLICFYNVFIILYSLVCLPVLVSTFLNHCLFFFNLLTPIYISPQSARTCALHLYRVTFISDFFFSCVPRKRFLTRFSSYNVCCHRPIHHFSLSHPIYLSLGLSLSITHSLTHSLSASLDSMHSSLQTSSSCTA